MKKLILLLFLSIFPILAFTYDLSGSMVKKDDDSYSVTLQNNYGHEYTGTAEDESDGDGTLDVSVQDYNGESYSGTATPSDEDDQTYDLDLTNNSSNGKATGTLTLNE